MNLQKLTWLTVSLFISGCASRAGAPGIGDPYYANLGNSGYDVVHYTITLAVDPATNSVNGTTLIQAQATQALRSLNLDLASLAVDSVKVNDEGATFSLHEHELTIKPAQQLASGASFEIKVAYHGTPLPLASVASTVFPTVGWFHSSNGAINVISEPNGAASWFPANDHPRDKATYTFDITVPHPWVVAAPGILRKMVDSPYQTQYVWEMDKPMASYLASINIDKYILETAPGPDGVTLRSYLTADLPQSLKENLAALPAMVEYFRRLFGPYPFDEYGIVVANSEIAPCQGFAEAVEVQTLSIHCPTPSMLDEAVLAHELAHQWFGDDVTIQNWQDIWLKEGMATYAEWMWKTRDEDIHALSRLVADQRAGYLHNFPIRTPPPADIYDDEVYTGGAQVFHALRLKVGDELFFKILREYLDRYRYGVASTDDFIAIAKEISGQNLTSFFDSWLTKTQLPELPQP